MALRVVLQRVLLKPIVWLVLRVSVKGRDGLSELDASKPFIVVANHSSHLDAPLVSCALPLKLARRVATAAANDYFFGKFTSRNFARALFNVFPVDRQGENCHKGLAARLITRGTPILIMPEGTRSRTGKLGEFHPGAARLAVEHGLPIVPITLVGAHDAWPPGRNILYVLAARRPRVTVIFGKVTKPSGETADELNKKLRASISKNLKK
ncbi:MAG: 1-acyl-sn-glycerol-3-phosphate acyltransferase [Candidatus Nomurabacteria bacterium]|jgi:1-acyl-sn-glycerol-3-phosphate acyltransferase|nr:1-acyl-sn-glycerol-3-phosphate acyltransferase [Candidatus Nomurabacteria bacterium]